MPRLPAIRTLAAIVRRDARGNWTAADSADFLIQRRHDLHHFPDLEHLALSTDAEHALTGTTLQTIKVARALGYHLTALRASLAKALWARQIFISIEVLDELIFYSLRDPETVDPVVAVLTWIRDAQANRPGLIVFPVHSLGILGAGLAQRRFGRVAILNKPYGYALSPQTNGMDGTHSFLEEAATELGIRKAIPTDLIDHWRRSRPTSWLERNPLLVVRAVQLPGSYYSNEGLLRTRLQATSGTLAMLAAFQRAPKREGQLFSTRIMNNWQTLDIHHYITLYDGGRRKRELLGQCVPIHGSKVAISELTDLELDIDPWHLARNRRLAERIHRAGEKAYHSSLHQRFVTHQPTAITRTARKLFDAVGFFRRSYGNSSAEWRAKVNLATAFEILLMDSYGAVTATLERRTRLLLKGVAGTRAMQRAVRELYEARSAFVHSGADEQVDLALARKAFVLCFVTLTERLARLSATTATPLADLVGDR